MKKRSAFFMDNKNYSKEFNEKVNEDFEILWKKIDVKRIKEKL